MKIHEVDSVYDISNVSNSANCFLQSTLKPIFELVLEDTHKPITNLEKDEDIICYDYSHNEEDLKWLKNIQSFFDASLTTKNLLVYSCNYTKENNSLIVYANLSKSDLLKITEFYLSSGLNKLQIGLGNKYNNSVYYEKDSVSWTSGHRRRQSFINSNHFQYCISLLSGTISNQEYQINLQRDIQKNLVHAKL